MLYAQTFINESISYIQQARVGLVDEFIKRFNGDKSHPDISSENSSSQASNLLYLFEVSQTAVNKDSIFDAAREMIDTIIANSVKLSFSDSSWIAMAKCKGELDGEQVLFNVYLNVEHRKEDMYKWVISKVDGDCFDTSSRDSSTNIMFYPDDHETKFMSLGRMTKEQPFNVLRFTSKWFQYDKTSAFIYLVQSNKLKISYVDELEFVFTQIPGYVFSIKYFERESSKSGWLIHKFERMSSKAKLDFLKSFNIASSENDIPKEMCILNNDSVSFIATNQEDLFNLRISERMILLKDYVSLLKTTDNQVEVAYFRKKLLELFDANSYVYISDGNSGYTNKISISKFLKKISPKTSDTIIIDKIVLPQWDDKLKETIGLKFNKDSLKSIIVSIKEFIKPLKSEISSQILVTYKEKTEDGIEWIPYFGNIYVTLKK